MVTPNRSDHDHVVVVDSPLLLVDSPLRSATNIPMEDDLGSFALDNLQARHFGLCNADAHIKHELILKPLKDQQAHFSLAAITGGVAATKFDGGPWRNLHYGQSFFTYDPGVEEVHRFDNNHRMKVQFIEVTTDHMTTMLSNTEPTKGSALWKFRDQFATGRFTGVQSDIAITSFQQIFQSMYNCQLHGALGNMMLEGCLQQLIAIQFASMDEAPREKSTVRFNDQKIIVDLKSYLDDHFLEDHSLSSLSQMFGINTNKLKTCFRQMYGTPVVEYLLNRRLEHARALLLDGSLHVNAIAHMVGYRYANHFSTAFKKKFGVKPSGLVM